MCTAHGVRGYPTLQYFAAGAKEGVRYSGHRDLPSLLSWVTEQSGAKPDAGDL